LDNPEKVANKH